MSLQIIALAFLAVALAAPQGENILWDETIQILSSNSEMNADGSYKFG